MRSAFTLLELLVVIAVIAVLVGLLLPALGSARKRGQAAVCLANLRTLAQGVTMYAGDHRDALPVSSHTTGNAFSPGNWIVTLVRYGVPEPARRCPNDPTKRTTSYVTNDYLEPKPTGGGFDRLHAIPRPPATAFALEAHPAYGVDHLHAHLDGWTSADQMLAEIDVKRHQGASNLAYLDGHAATRTWDDVKATYRADANFLNPAVAR